jgi:hypothetical protein
VPSAEVLQHDLKGAAELIARKGARRWGAQPAAAGEPVVELVQLAPSLVDGASGGFRTASWASEGGLARGTLVKARLARIRQAARSARRDPCAHAWAGAAGARGGGRLGVYGGRAAQPGGEHGMA